MTRTYRLDMTKPQGQRLVDVTEAKAAAEELAFANAEVDRTEHCLQSAEDWVAEALEERRQARVDYRKALARLCAAIANQPKDAA